MIPISIIILAVIIYYIINKDSINEEDKDIFMTDDNYGNYNRFIEKVYDCIIIKYPDYKITDKSKSNKGLEICDKDDMGYSCNKYLRGYINNQLHINITISPLDMVKKEFNIMVLTNRFHKKDKFIIGYANESHKIIANKIIKLIEEIIDTLNKQHYPIKI